MSVYLFAHTQFEDDKKYSQLGKKKYAPLELFDSMTEQFQYDVPVVQLNRHLIPILEEAKINYKRNNFNIELTNSELKRLCKKAYIYTKAKPESSYQKRQYDLLFQFLTVCLEKNLIVKTY